MEFHCLVLFHQTNRTALEQGLAQFAHQSGCALDVQWFSEHSDLIYRMREGALCDGVLVAHPGALGMEAVLRVRERAPHLPIVWCSEDAGFALASYRQQCAMFLLLPVKEGDLAQAMMRCIKAS